MTTRTFIVKHRSNAEVERIIEAKSRRAVENAILEDYSIEGVKGANVGEALRLQAKGIRPEKLEG